MNGILGVTELALETNLTREQYEYLSTVKASEMSLIAGGEEARCVRALRRAAESVPEQHRWGGFGRSNHTQLSGNPTCRELIVAASRRHRNAA